MFTPPKFQQADPAELHRFVQHHPLATLVVQTKQGLEATHIPLYWQCQPNGHGCLLGHFAKANPIWQNALPEQAWLAIFQDSGHYISANWYPAKQQHHKVVPTWNYQAVHIYGQGRLLESEADAHRILTLLTEQHEQSQARRWRLADAPADYIQAMCRAIMCFEITIERIEGKYKLSQNQTEANRQGVVNGLLAENTAAARQMAARIEQFSPPQSQP